MKCVSQLISGVTILTGNVTRASSPAASAAQLDEGQVDASTKLDVESDEYGLMSESMDRNHANIRIYE